MKTVTSLPDLDLQSDIDDNTNNGGQSDAATYWAGVRTEVFSVEDRLQNDVVWTQNVLLVQEKKVSVF